MRPLLLALMLLFVSTLGAAQSPQDSAGVRAAARDYIVAWYNGDAALMEQVLHPDLAKRNVAADQNGRARFSHMGAMAMVAMTRTRRPQAEDRRLLEVTILDIYGAAATAKVVSWDFVDYVHLAQVDGRWVIVNDLWSRRTQ